MQALNTKDPGKVGRKEGLELLFCHRRYSSSLYSLRIREFFISVQNIRTVNISVTNVNFDSLPRPLIVNVVEDASDGKDQVVIVVRQPLIWLRLINETISQAR